VGQREAILAPADAVVERGQLRGFWIVDDAQHVHLRWVRLGAQRGDDIEVLSGLSGGEILVARAEQPLAEGDRVEK
jgi:hypothetical protein